MEILVRPKFLITRGNIPKYPYNTRGNQVVKLHKSTAYKVAFFRHLFITNSLIFNIIVQIYSNKHIDNLNFGNNVYKCYTHYYVKLSTLTTNVTVAFLTFLSLHICRYNVAILAFA